jgi:flagellar motor switch protein FliM
VADRVLSQEEIDNVFNKTKDTDQEDSRRAIPYDFRRPDRIAKDQLRSIHLLHENFARSVASSLSGYLRQYVTANLVSVEQLSFLEFTQCLPSPTTLIALGLRPFDGNAVLEINPALVFPILEMLLGGGGKGITKLSREITEIEQHVLESFLRIVLTICARPGARSAKSNSPSNRTKPNPPFCNSWLRMRLWLPSAWNCVLGIRRAC